MLIISLFLLLFYFIILIIVIIIIYFMISFVTRCYAFLPLRNCLRPQNIFASEPFDREGQPWFELLLQLRSWNVKWCKCQKRKFSIQKVKTWNVRAELEPKTRSNGAMWFCLEQERSRSTENFYCSTARNFFYYLNILSLYKSKWMIFLIKTNSHFFIIEKIYRRAGQSGVKEA